VNPPLNRSGRFFFQAALIVLFAFALRTMSLAQTPLFIDEALHINRAHSAVAGHIFEGLRVNKWLYPVVLGLVFRPLGPEGPWLARVLSALFSTITVSVGVALGRMLFQDTVGKAGSRRIGLLAGLVYAVLPMTVFHERQALVDPMMVAFTGLSILLTIRLVRQPRLWVAVPLSLVLAFAFLTKLLAIPYLVLPLAASVLLPRDRRAVWKALLPSALSVVVAVALILPVYWVAEASGFKPSRGVQPSVDNTLLGSFLEPETMTTLQSHLRDVGQTFGYLGVGVIALVVLSIVWLALGESRREIGFLLVPGLAFMALPILAEQVTATGRLPSRYLLASTLPLILLAARSLQILMRRLGSLPRAVPTLTGLLFLGAILGQSLYFDVALIDDLQQAPLAAHDKLEYQNEQSASTHELAAALKDVWRTSGRRVNALGPGPALIYLEADLGPRVGTYSNSFLDRTDQIVHRFARLSTWLSTDEEVFLFDQDEYVPAIRHLDGAQTSQVGTYGVWTLLHVDGAGTPLAEDILLRLAGDPLFMGDDHDALALSLSKTPPTLVVVFPSGHAPELAARTGLYVVPFDTGHWPLTTPTIEAALADLDLGTAGEPVDFVLVNEAATDPQRTLGLALRQNLYPTGFEEWFGLLHRKRFVTGPINPPLAPIGGEFEDAIELIQGAIIDPVVEPGNAVRLALTWRSTVAVQDPFVVFVHVVDSSGTIWAQHDSEPGDGLRPMPSWEPGERVDDRFAIQLPPDTPPGEYEVRIGLYQPANGLRLRVTDGKEVASDYIVFGRFSVGG
jgi:4-amino-4-deoxy-L-arabinose transferase-like glycosyltransferase